MQYSPFNMISYGTRSHLHVFTQCIFLGRVSDFFERKKLLQWKHSKNPQCSGFLLCFSCILMHFAFFA
ncbi:unnamed protein product [Staurois parvus]|uniref:Uncharacterized protein n=1 Tax=Staurois parvus TaxID=386267 RepID=A0ABN9C1R8_9NEOB|nr:unnamed protein product [Staurois parvus]